MEIAGLPIGARLSSGAGSPTLRGSPTRRGSLPVHDRL